MILYRLGPFKWIDVWDGIGSAKSGARWNSAKVPAIYLGSSQALALLEVRAHSGELPHDYAMAKVEFPDDVPIYEPALSALPTNWADIPPTVASQKFGDTFITRNEELLMRIPSVIVQEEWNYVLDPAHPDRTRMKVLSIHKFTVDERLYEVKKK
jgi:RES domain-containing protein